jgi:hypothetical protein
VVSFFLFFSHLAWEGALLGSSPGESYSGSSSPPLSDDGNVSSSSTSSSDQKYIIKQNHGKIQINQHNLMVNHVRRGHRTTSLSTSDEGIVMDYGEEMPRKKRVSSLQIPLKKMFSRKSLKWAHEWAHTSFNQRSNCGVGAPQNSFQFFFFCV